MRKFILMHVTEAGFDSTEIALQVAKNFDNPHSYRVVEILVDPVTEAIANEMHQQALEQAFRDGEESARRAIRSKLGL